MQVNHVADSLARTVERACTELRAIDDSMTTGKPAPGAWSAREILGHLIDSAANNHHRFVRAQHSDRLVFPKYEQDAWVTAQDYQSRPWNELVDLWRLYNRHLEHVIRQVPSEKLGLECVIDPYPPASLGYLIEDYVTHLEHHLQQIRARTEASRDSGQ